MSSVNKRKFVTKIKSVKTSYEWKFENFLLNNKKTTEGFYSPPFTIDGIDQLKWLIAVYPRGDTEEEKNYIAVFLRAEAANINHKLKFVFSIVNNNNIKVHRTCASYHYKVRAGAGFDKFIKTEFLEQHKESLLPNNELTLCCDIEVNLNDETFEIDTNHGSKHFKLKTYEEHVQTCQDLGKLLENQELTDVVLKTCHKELRAHKTILAARSPVFLAMFSNNTVEKLQSEIKIIDFDSEVVSDMLEFMYTGKVKNIEKNVMSLLHIGDKYQIMGLKHLCENFLCCTMSIENASDLLILADRHNSEDLKTIVIQFILSNKQEVIKTPQFINLMSEQPSLVADLFFAEC